MLIGSWFATVQAADPPPAAPTPLAEAASAMTLPDGFPPPTLFAGEPDVRQPIAFTIDHRGRLWVAENFTYPGWRQKATEKDRIVILEDTDGDGRFDQRKVFWDQGDTVSGLTLGFGGVYVCATPNLLFIPDKDGDDVPDGPPVVVLDGWDVKAQHNMFNALTWGPDGWLLRLQRDHVELESRQARHSRRRSRRHQLRRLALSSDPGSRSRPSRTARRTPGGSTLTTTAKRLSRTA